MGDLGHNSQADVEGCGRISGLPIPPELLLRIFTLCAGGWDIPYVQTLAALRRVCKDWKPLIEEVIVRRVTVSNQIQATLFLEWAWNSGLQSRVKKCLLLPWTSLNPDGAVHLHLFTPLLSGCPKIQSLEINHLCIEDIVPLAPHVPNLKELRVIDYGQTRIGDPMHMRSWDLNSLVSGLSSLQSLTLEFTDFTKEDEVLPLSLRSLHLVICTECDQGAIDRVFAKSQFTLQQYTFAAAYMTGRPRKTVSMPTIISPETPLNDLVLLDNHNSSHRPTSVHSIRMLCTTLPLLLQLRHELRPLISNFSRLVLTNRSVGDLEALSNESIQNDSPHNHWDQLKWLEVESTLFSEPRTFERFMLPWGRFVRVLSLGQVSCVPAELNPIFPQLEVLRIAEASINDGYWRCRLEPGWFVPTLKVFCITVPRSPRIYDLDSFTAALEQRACSLRLFLCRREWAEGSTNATERFRELCKIYNIDILTICENPLTNYLVHDDFELWARHFALL